MHRLFWLMVGMFLGAWAYRYYEREGLEGMGLGDLGDRGRRLKEHSQQFVESGKSLADSGRQLASEGRDFAQAAMDTAQTRGKEAVEKVKSQARTREDVGMQTGSGI